MRKLIAGALLLVLSGVTSIAQAAFAPAPRPVVAEVQPRPVAAQPTPPAPASEAGDYAKREAANPALGEYQGGDTAIYIGSGAVTVLVIVLLILLVA
jgi:hypothetical protein